MNFISHHVLFAHPASPISVVALLFAFSGCANSVTPPVSPESQLIAAANLPAGWIAPRVVRAVAPAFPNNLKRAGIEGEVSLMCLIDEKGDVRHVAIAEASDAAFVDPARLALQEWKFTPGSRDGQSVAMSIVVPIRFIFDDTAAAPKPSAYLAAALLP